MKNPKIFVVVAAYNVEKKIGSVISDLIKHNYNNIVVVNDCSTDKTEEVARKKGVVVLSHIINRGQGAALRTGNEYVLKEGADIIVHFDGDGQMLAKDIKQVIRPIIEGKSDVVYGSRYMSKKSDVPSAIMLAHKLGNIWLRLQGVKMTDPQSGFRALSRKAAEQIVILQDRAEHATEILLEVFSKKLRCKEVPVTIKYTDYSKQHTQHGKFHLWSGIKIAFKVMLKRLMS